MHRLSLVCLLLCAAPACADHVVTERDRAVTLAPGEPLVVRLPVNPSTGYCWHVSGSTPLLKQVAKSRFVDSEPGGPEPQIGQPAVHEFRFRAQTGSGVLRLEYRRVYEREPTRVYLLRVTVPEPKE